MASTPETRVKAKVKRWLMKHAAWWTAISDRYHVGLPDFFCILSDYPSIGRLTAIEAKSEIGKPTRRQIEEARRITRAGGEYYIATPNPDTEHGFELNVVPININAKGVIV